MSSVPDRATGGHELPDVTEMPLAQLAIDEDTVLGNALRRYHLEALRPPENLSAFGSFAE
jgi:FXSXX-COOH protein